MDADLIKAVATQVVDQTILSNWEYWLCGMAILFATSFGGSYAAKRGEFKAAQADRDKILSQLAENTATTARINSIVSLGEWTERERRTLRRTKLEELIIGAHKTMDWLDVEYNRAIWDSENTPGPISSPMPMVMALGILYVQELGQTLLDYADAVSVYETQLLTVSLAIAKGREEAVKSGSREMAVQRKIDILESTVCDETFKKLGLVKQALDKLDIKAGTVMADILAAPSATEGV